MVTRTLPSLLAHRALWPLLLSPLAFVGGDYELRFLAEILIVGTAVLGLDILVGLGGLVSLGHAAVFGGAAYAAALFSYNVTTDLTLILLVGIGAGVMLAGIMGIFVMRATNLFFLILTLVAAQMLWEVLFHWRGLTGGADGLRGLPILVLNLGFVSFPLEKAPALVGLSISLAVVALFTAQSFADAPVGRALAGYREQPLRMKALGYSSGRIRLIAMLVSGGIAGAAGALYPFINQYIGLNIVHWSMSAMMVIMLVIGGVGSLHGAFIGAAVYLSTQTYISSYTERWQLLVGLIFIFTVLLMPNGIVGKLRWGLHRWKESRS